jgi:hypothetical protein
MTATLERRLSALERDAAPAKARCLPTVLPATADDDELEAWRSRSTEVFREDDPELYELFL